MHTLTYHAHMHALIHTFTRVCIHMYSHTLDHAHIQSTHVELYFTVEEQQERRTKFEWENKISWFVFVTPFTPDSKQRGDVTRQCTLPVCGVVPFPFQRILQCSILYSIPYWLCVYG